ncbi:sigma-E processing peptidase SpoIIGA [Clostridium fermenticellae]|uniref:Sporulation sigma-E factor-processing peptidase n=1 Tax=Clostridium fermenticellae TaxID=2068654 RepID=A0A386H2Q2_9CLOT|nr:sigma-E processing peptidase SpoIIGA [Clostridium fermenticellae]AYD39991.1 sigma-E processing peptidase SpoIIGA [Clostridium fermenticellae]
MIVYIDVLILENVIVNFFLLYLTARTLKIEIKFVYIFISAVFGGMYTIVLVYPALFRFSSILFKLLAALIMVFIAFRCKELKLNFKILCIFILYSMVLAGMCMFIEYNNSIYENYFAIYDFSYKKLMISIMLIYMCIDRILIYVKDKKSINKFVFKVDIVLDNSVKTINAFLDTGNELREPATNLPVIVVEESIFKDIDLNVYDKFYIPYKVINGQSGVMKGIKPKCVVIHENDKSEKKDAIIAFCNKKLSEFNEYNALLSRSMTF